MYGDVEKYCKSLIIIISKSIDGYKENDAIQYFKKVSELALIKGEKNVLKLVKKLANKEIPIIIVYAPCLPIMPKTKKFISSEEAINVTDQYEDTIQNFVNVIKKLKPTN